MIDEFANLNSERFEDLVRDIFNFKEGTNSYQKYGMLGQKQDGIDIYSSETQVAIQCKFLQKTNGKEARQKFLRVIHSEINKIKNSILPIKNFFIVSNFPHDRSIIDECIKYQYKEALKYSVSYIGWNELRKWILKNNSIIRDYFPNTFNLNRQDVEVAWVSVDSDLCGWIPSKSDYNSFFFQDNGKPAIPVFDFRLINHSDNIVILNRIDLGIEILPMPLSGFDDEKPSGFLESIGNIPFELKRNEHINSLNLKNPIYVKGDNPFRFKLSLFYRDPEIWFDTGRLVLNFKFYFSDNKIISVDPIYLNCSEARKELRLLIIE